MVHEKYKAVTDLMTDRQPSIADAVMDGAIFAYADHKRMPRGDDANQGEGFGKTMYESVSEALLSAKYGVTGDDVSALGDETFQRDFQRYMIAQQIGITEKGLDKDYKDKKTLSADDLDSVRRTVGQTLGRAQDYDVNGELEDLTQDDVEEYSEFLRGVASELGLGDDRIPQMRTVEECLKFHKKIGGVMRDMSSLEDRL